MSKHAVILVPNHSGGIDRLFENLPALWQPTTSEYSIELFHTHGRSLFGQSFLPFKLVYYASAAFFMVFFLPSRLARFAWMCSRSRVDVCHINLSAGASTFRKSIFAAICRRYRIPYVLHLHSGNYQRFFANAMPAKRKRIQKLFDGAAKVLVLGRIWHDFVKDVIGLSADKLEILPNVVAGPEIDNASDKAQPPCILFLGRLFKPKGIEELIVALGDERMRPLEWTAVLAGDGDVAKYRKQVEVSGLAGRVSLPGWVGPDEVKNLLTRSAIFVLPSHAENLPLSMLEAMAHGLCPIVTPVGSVEDVVEDRKNGLIIPVADSNTLTDVLVKAVLNHDNYRTTLAHNARRTFLQNHNIDNYQQRLESIYRKAAA